MYPGVYILLPKRNINYRLLPYSCNLYILVNYVLLQFVISVLYSYCTQHIFIFQVIFRHSPKLIQVHGNVNPRILCAVYLLSEPFTICYVSKDCLFSVVKINPCRFGVKNCFIFYPDACHKK